MSTIRKSVLRRGARVAGLGAAAAVVLGLMSTGAANADTFVPLPGGEKVVNAGSVTAKIARNAESALVSPSLAANGAGRVAWVSGDVFAELGGEIPEEGATLTTGYIVGCQADITGLDGGLSADLGLDSLGLGGSLSIPISAGEVKFAKIRSKTDLKPGVSAIQYRDQQLALYCRSRQGADAQEVMAARIVAEGMSVRATEEAVTLANRSDDQVQPAQRRKPIQMPGLQDVAERLSDSFDTRVTVSLGKRKGKIVVEFGSVDDLQRIVGMMEAQKADS